MPTTVLLRGRTRWPAGTVRCGPGRPGLDGGGVVELVEKPGAVGASVPCGCGDAAVVGANDVAGVQRGGVVEGGCALGGPHSTPAPEISPRFLSEDERIKIADLHRARHGVWDIAARTGRSPATISRELRRNRDQESGRYRPFAAHRLAVQRRTRRRPGKIAGDPVLRGFVQDRLGKKWSPEQISQALRAEFPHHPERHVVHETIYQAVYRPDLGGLARDLPEKALRTGRRRRKPHRHADSRRPQPLVDMTMIDARPAEVADRAVPGHWEGDLITGAHNRSAIGTLVERSSRFTILLHLPDGRHTADLVRDALVEAFTRLPVAVRRSLTWDQGKEMALHAQVAGTLAMPVFFCQKASPWQRPSNENTNGLLRQYFPKGTDLRIHTAEQLARITGPISAAPRS